MQIVIADANGNDVLVHGPSRASANYATGPIGEITLLDDHSMQISPLLRAAVAKVFARGNVHCTCQFAAERSFTTLFAAKSWLARHMIGVRRSNKLIIREGTSTLELTGGALGPITTTGVGVEITLHYTFIFTGVA